MKKAMTLLSTLLYISAVFGLSIFGRCLSDTLRENYLLSKTVTLLSLCLLTFLSIRFKVYSAVYRFLMLFLLILFTASLSLLTNTVEEKFHILEFGFLSILVFQTLKTYSQPFTFVKTLFITSLVGVSDECIQIYLPHRYFDWKDMALNVASGILFLSAIYFFSHTIEQDNSAEIKYPK